MNTVSTRSVLCWVALCSTRRQKRNEVLYFWREFAAINPDELVTEGGSFYLPDDVAFYFASLFPIHKQAQELTTSNDTSSRVTKTCCPRRFTYPEFPVLTGLKD